MGVVYLITGPTGKQHVGYTMRTVEKRWYEHQHMTTSSLVALDIQLYGADRFTIEVLFESTDRELLWAIERFFIKEFDTLSPNGYNVSPGNTNYKATSILKKDVFMFCNWGMFNIQIKKRNYLLCLIHRFIIMRMISKVLSRNLLKYKHSKYIG